jgi:hypothetical protein
MGDVPLLGTRKPDEHNTGPVLRLLHCKVCSSIEELPPFNGKPEEDHLLQIACENHRFPSGDEHKGLLFIVPVKVWMNTDARKDVIRQIKGGGSKGLAEIDDSFYDTKSQFGEDAMSCWKQKNKPQDNCDEYQSERKRLLPDTTKERKELGMDKIGDTGPKNYLCHFCPIHSKVVQRKRQLMGLYD